MVQKKILVTKSMQGRSGHSGAANSAEAMVLERLDLENPMKQLEVADIATAETTPMTTTDAENNLPLHDDDDEEEEEERGRERGG